ncbi:MAG: hypothetical protein C4589_06155 [Peptococcaceae bacterium]|nr:MAG: hypothetical protein C4589_06155 [Peptococcaceae bacterium]
MRKKFSFKLVVSLLLTFAMLAGQVVVFAPATAEAAAPTMKVNTLDVGITKYKGRTLANALALKTALEAGSSASVTTGIDFNVKYKDKELRITLGTRQGFLTTGIGQAAPEQKTIYLQGYLITRDKKLYVPIYDIMRHLGGTITKDPDTGVLEATLAPGAPVAPYTFGSNSKDIVGGADDSVALVGRGASFPWPIYWKGSSESWLKKYFDLSKDIDANVGGYNEKDHAGAGVASLVYDGVTFGSSTGSGSGIDAVRLPTPAGIAAGTYERYADFGGTDAIAEVPVSDRNDYALFPTVMGGVAIAYNVKDAEKNEITSNLRFTPDLVADIYLGKVTKWNDPRIKALNSSINLPDTTINVVYRSDGSGTTEIFTTYLTNVSKAWRTEADNPDEDITVNMKDKVVNRGSHFYGAAGNDQVAKAIKGEQFKEKKSPDVFNQITVDPKNDSVNTFGYVVTSETISNELTHAKIRNYRGNYVLPSNPTITAAGLTAKSLTDHPVNGTNPAAYPITGFTYMMIENDPTTAKPVAETVGKDTNGDKVKFIRPAITGAAVTERAKRIALIKDYVRWAVVYGYGDTEAVNQKYAPLTPNVKMQVDRLLDTF